MTSFPDTDETPVLRVDFSDDDVWRSVCQAIVTPVPFDEHMEFRAKVSFIDNRTFDGAGVSDIPALAPKDSHTVVLAVDSKTIHDAENPILCIDLFESPGRYFRFIPAVSWAVENNLSLANMDFEDFEEMCDSDGILRHVPTGPGE